MFFVNHQRERLASQQSQGMTGGCVMGGDIKCEAGSKHSPWVHTGPPSTAGLPSFVRQLQTLAQTPLGGYLWLV